MSLNMLMILCLTGGVLAHLYADPMKAEKKNQWATVYTPKVETWKGTTIPAVFLGDSIFHGWNWSASEPNNPGGLEIWNHDFQDFKPENLSISGDRVEHLLWRITEGRQLSGYTAKVVVVLIGVNNLIRNEDPASVAAGIVNLNKEILKQQPTAKILLLGILPYSWDRNGSAEKVNLIIRKSADGGKIVYLDLTSEFKDQSGKTRHLRDGIHPNPEGYQKMADRLGPEVRKLLQQPGNT